MPIDFNKPLGATAASAASSALPTKTSMNLLVHEKKARGAWKYVLAVLLLAALVALFSKFAVLDVFKQVDLKQSELYAAQQELAAVQSQLENYDAVLEEYRSYTGIASEGTIDALSVMNMVASVVEPRATVTGVSTSEGTLLVNVKGISLKDLGKLADVLRAERMVKDVVVTTATEASDKQQASENAASEDAKQIAASLQVTLVNPSAEGGQ